MDSSPWTSAHDVLAPPSPGTSGSGTEEGSPPLDGKEPHAALRPADLAILELVATTDVIMPGMSGKTLAERLRGSLPGLRVLYMSGYTDNIIAQDGVLLPGTTFLEKPFAFSELEAKVRAALEDA